MIETLSIEEFTNSSLNDREIYILKKMQLADFWVIGCVRNPFEEKPFFFIEQLVNPYTGLTLESEIFSDFSRPLSIYCRKKGKSNQYEEGALVAAKVTLTDYINEIKKGNILNTTSNEVYPIEDSNEIFDLVGLKKEDLGIVALAKPTLYKDRKSHFADVAGIIKTKIEKDIVDLNKKLKENKQQLLYMEKQEEKLDKTEQYLHILQQKLETLGFEFDYSSEAIMNKKEGSFLKIPKTTFDLLKGIQSQLSLRGYHYEEKTLRQILLALMTEQMIILSGPSGTGKTTIVKQLASVVNANYEIIPIQPSWTDKQDLLGFYNPMRKLYVPSPFLDCLIKAKENKDQLYFICLDEINLAQIEYYLADILSIRELEEGSLRLFSEFENKQNMNEIKWFIQHMLNEEYTSIDEALKKIQMNSLDHYEMIIRYENLKRYTPILEIPPNVRIIGTMNVDGTVQALSPKVIDRSFIIPIDRQNKESINSVLEIGTYNIPAETFMLNNSEAPKISKKLNEAISEIKQELAKWHIEYNERLEKHILLYYAASEKLGSSNEQQIDDIILTKLLPRLHEIIDNEQLISSLLEVIKRHVKNEPLSMRKLEKMKQRFNQTDLFSYWS